VMESGCEFCGATGYEDYPSCRVPCRINGHREQGDRDVAAALSAIGRPWSTAKGPCPFCKQGPCEHWTGYGWINPKSIRSSRLHPACLKPLDKQGNARCALPNAHQGECGPAPEVALRPHEFQTSSRSCEHPGQDTCVLCHCIAQHPVHAVEEKPREGAAIPSEWTEGVIPPSGEPRYRGPREDVLEYKPENICRYCGCTPGHAYEAHMGMYCQPSPNGIHDFSPGPPHPKVKPSPNDVFPAATGEPSSEQPEKHYAPEEPFIPIEDRPVDIPAELERLERLIIYAVDDAPQHLRGAEPLLHKAAALAWISQAESLRKIAGEIEELCDTMALISDGPADSNRGGPLTRIAEALERQAPVSSGMESPAAGNGDTRRTGDWIQTYTGRQFWPLDPRPEDVHIKDIAHALSNICRYTGHVREFYSVAEHSVRVSRIVPEEHALWGLMHDASEAYICDVARPVKRFPGFGELYRQIEDRLMECICERFRMDPSMDPSVKTADNILLHTERRDLMARLPQPWRDSVAPLDEFIIPWTPKMAERAFLERFEEIMLKIPTLKRKPGQNQSETP